MQWWKSPGVLAAGIALAILAVVATVVSVPWWMFVAWVVPAALAGLGAVEAESRTAARAARPVHYRVHEGAGQPG